MLPQIPFRRQPLSPDLPILRPWKLNMLCSVTTCVLMLCCVASWNFRLYCSAGDGRLGFVGKTWKHILGKKLWNQLHGTFILATVSSYTLLQFKDCFTVQCCCAGTRLLIAWNGSLKFHFQGIPNNTLLSSQQCQHTSDDKCYHPFLQHHHSPFSSSSACAVWWSAKIGLGDEK